MWHRAKFFVFQNRRRFLVSCGEISIHPRASLVVMPSTLLGCSFCQDFSRKNTSVFYEMCTYIIV